jgi:Xaa-Pro aminopeptidase
VGILEKTGPGEGAFPMNSSKEKTMRLARLRKALPEHNLDAILISQPENRRYLSGFTGSAGFLAISADRAILATDFRYYEQMGREAPGFELAKITVKFSDVLPEIVADLGVKRLGFESEHVTVDQLKTLNEVTEGVEWTPLKETVEKIRIVKGAAEVKALRRSVALNDAAFAHLLEGIEPGMTERDAAWAIESYMRTHGAKQVAFPLIVAAGSNGALPHAQPGDHVIQEGEPIIIDIGCVVDGYCSDMTRTICLGQPSDKYLEIWGLVLKAQEAALEGIRAGMNGVDADALARDVIDEAGYGEQFGHGLGHGVGLSVHERPRASKLSEDTYRAGMSLTVEPGIYLPGEFGVRIEDLVIIREDGVENLTGTPKTPAVG